MQGNKRTQFGGGIFRDVVAQLFQLPPRQFDGGLKAQTLILHFMRFNRIVRDVVQTLLQ